MYGLGIIKKFIENRTVSVYIFTKRLKSIKVISYQILKIFNLLDSFY